MFESLITVILSLLILNSPVLAVNDNVTLKIYDFKQGLMREHNDIYKVYNQGHEFQYQTNGSCTYNKKKYQCMWFGFSFKTTQDIKNISLHCTVTLSSPDGIGNPKEELGKQLQKINIQIDLESDNGYFSNSQYLIKEPNILSQTITTTCSHKGVEMFKSNFFIKFGV